MNQPGVLASRVRSWAATPPWLASRRRRLLLLAAAIALLALGAVAVELARIRADLEAGRSQLSALDLATVDERGGIAAVVDAAADHLDAAEHRARTSPVLGLVARIPGLGGQVDALRELTASVAGLAAEGRAVATTLDDTLEASGSGPGRRLALAEVAGRELDHLGAYLAEVDLGAEGWLLPPLASAREDLETALIEARGELGQASLASEALAEFLRGPRRYLIAAGNNAEMRTAGVITSSGVVDIDGGELAVGDFIRNDRRVASREPVPVPDEWLHLYGWRWGHFRYPGTLYTPNFPVAAEIIGEISARNIHGPVDGVIYVDTLTLARILEVIGPVEVEGRRYDSTNVVDEILYRNYLEFPTRQENAERKELQSQIAQTAFDALDTRDYSIFALADALADAAASRHLMAWSADPQENELWQIVQADGHLEADDVLVQVANIDSSKLDYFVTVDVDVTTELAEDEDVRRATMAVTITNPEREETTPYIEGTSGIIEEPGEHVAWLVYYLPQYATNITAEDFGGFGHTGPDGPLYAVGSVVRIPLGESRTYTITFDLPVDQYVLTVLPSARIRATTWTFDGVGPLPDFVPFTFDLETHDITIDDRQAPRELSRG